MRYWMREVAGWLLVGLGLMTFYLSYLMLRNHDVMEAWPLAFIGFILFRGGIHLLKVAVAARLWARAQQGLETRAASRPRPALPARRS